jgi:hypothetical protein
MTEVESLIETFNGDEKEALLALSYAALGDAPSMTPGRAKTLLSLLQRFQNAARTLSAERDSWKERAEAAEAALKPFAGAADDIDDTTPDRVDMWENPAAMNVTAGDFRRARSLVQP